MFVQGFGFGFKVRALTLYIYIYMFYQIDTCCCIRRTSVYSDLISWCRYVYVPSVYISSTRVCVYMQLCD